jgi:hypothetical protein
MATGDMRYSGSALDQDPAVGIASGTLFGGALWILLYLFL